MPDVNADAQKAALVANPHKVGWFWRLLGLYQQQSHPLSAELYGGAEDEKSLVAAWWEKQLSLGADRKERYRIYEEMDSFDMVSGVLDIYAEESTQKDYDRGLSVWIESKSRAMIDAGNDCLRNCQVEDRVTPMIRRMCKFGDAFQRLIYQTGKGVLSWRYASTIAISRVEDKYNRLIGFREDGKQYRQKNRKISWPWDYVHFRLLGKDEESGHGTSILGAMFRPWRQMCLVSGTRIWTTRGPVPVEKLEVGDTTYCHDFETGETRETDVVKLISMGEQDLLYIRTRHRSITVNENHGLLVKDAQGNFLYKRAKDLVVRRESNPKKTDQLVLPSVLYGEDTQTVIINPADYFVRLVKSADIVSAGIMGRIRKCNLATSAKNAHTFLRGMRKIRHSDYIKLLKEFRLPEATVHVLHSNKPSPFGVDMRFTYGVDFLRLFGFMLGDGWVRGKLVGFALGIDEAQNQNYINLFCSIFGIDKYSREEAVFGEKGATVAFHSKATADLFRAVGFCTGFANKIVPDQMFGLSVAGKRALIEGMFDADGGYYESPTDSNAGWRLTLANKQLIDDIVMLSQQVGFDVSHEPAVIEREGKQTAYRIWINARMPAVPEPVMYENVLEVTRVGCGETWDLTVDDDLHNFVAEGVVSHNTLTEDSILMYRLRRAPDRNMIMVDVGDMEEHEAMDMVNVWRKRFRKHEFVDPASPNYKKQYNPLTPLEDIFIPIRGQDTATRIETLSGSGNVEDVYDLQHYVNKFSAASKVPKAYLGFESEINAKATLMQQDVRFARTIKRVQKAAMYGLRQLLDIHYTLLPTTPDENKYGFTIPENAYVVQMSPISYLDEWERLELMQLRYQIVEAMSRLAMDMQLDARVWSAYVLLNYAKLPEDLVMKLIAKSPDKVGMEGLENLTDIFGIEPKKYKQIMDDPKQRAQIMESMGTAGFYSVAPAEEIAIAKLMHESAPLRKVVGDIAEYHTDLVEQATLQTDPSLLPPIVRGIVLEDAYEDDAEAKILREDMQALEEGEEEKPLTEDTA